VGYSDDLGAVTNRKALIGQHRLDGGHDTRGRPVLPHVEGGLDKEDGKQDYGESQVRRGRGFTQGLPGDEDKNGCDEED
jgi:hypothetical protein